MALSCFTFTLYTFPKNNHSFMPTPIRVGLAGFGISAQVFHAPFFATMPSYTLVSVLERHARTAAEKYPGTRVVKDMDELLDDPEIELVVITTPNETHFDYAARALRKGKHVVVEKPFAVNSREGLALMAIAAESNRTLSVYQNRRYVSDFLTIRRILEAKLLGTVHEFEAHYDRYRPGARPGAWREIPLAGSGILFDLGPHIIDQALCLFGLPDSLYADIRKERPHARVDDYFDIQLYYPGLKVILKGGMLVREPGPRYMIHGFDGSYIKSGEDPQEARLRAGELPLGADWGAEPPENAGILHTEQEGAVIFTRYPTLPGNYGLYYQHLYETLREGAPLRERPEHGFNTIRLIEIAIESNRQKRVLEVSGLMDVPYNH
jgi:scyllo-inositol 2-dehydrogenase (NADP+)